MVTSHLHAHLHEAGTNLAPNLGLWRINFSADHIISEVIGYHAGL